MDISKLEIGNVLVYIGLNNSPETIKLSNFTTGKEYVIENFYEGRYGVVLTDDRGYSVKVCNDNVESFFHLVDNVNHPKHYTSHPSGVDCITITRHYCFSIGNAIKYLWRAGLKKDASLEDKQKEIEDLEKAIWYIKDRIKQLKDDTA